ncbi:MAG: GNAT family N-acetyltransferase [Thermoplasmata archaeon]
MEIKELEKSEIAKVVEFYGEVTLSAEGKEAGKKRFEEEITNAIGKDHMLLALEDEESIGFSWSQIHESKEGKKIDKVIMLLISPDRYGIGIGGQLMEKEREYAKEKGVDVLDIETG